MLPIPLSPGDIVTLIDKGINIVARFREKCADNLVGKSAEARALLSLYEFLREVYYDIPILTGPDGPFPVGLLPVSAAAASNADRWSVKLASTAVPARDAPRNRGGASAAWCRSLEWDDVFAEPPRFRQERCGRWPRRISRLLLRDGKFSRLSGVRVT